MSTANGAALLTPEQTKLLETIKTTLPLDRQLSWLQLGRAKANVEDTMKQKSLELQGLLLHYETMDLKALQEAVDNYVAGLKLIPDIRKGFTRYLDKIADQLMEIQKLAENYEGLAKAKERLLKMREDVEKQLDQKAKILEEQSEFKKHVSNEYLRVSSEYEKSLIRTIADAYTQALDQELTEDGLKQFVTVTAAAMRDLKPPAVSKFDYKLNSKEDLLKIHQSIPTPDYASLLSKYDKAMREKFNLYFQDKANGEKAKQFIQDRAHEMESQVETKSANAQAVNTLLSKGTVGKTTGLEPLGFKKVQRKFFIELEESNPQWALKIISEFLARFDSCAPRLKIKSWANLSVKQMAGALQEEDEQIVGLTYTEVKK